MWKKKRVTPYGFCGCPPCGLCFDWVEPAPPEKVEKEEVMIPGLVKMAMDVTGKAEADVLPQEAQAMQEYCEGVHERRTLGALGPKSPDTDGIALIPPDELVWIEKQITQKREAKEAEKAYEEARKKPKVLDHIDWTEEDRKAEQEESLKKEAEKEKKKEMDKATQRQKEAMDAYDRLLRR